MQQKLIFATNNQFKFDEVKYILSNKLSLISLKELNFSGNIPEAHNSLQENAQAKALYIYNKFEINCFADDTGLEIDALNGQPGVHSARFAGNHCSFEDNIEKVLNKMAGVKDRKAKFITIISLVENGDITNFEGFVYGEIINERRGDYGFGYDPIFIPDGFKLTFAEMLPEEKSKISHRYLAIEKLANYLNSKINY